MNSVAVYLRVSTEKQTVDNQRADVDRWLLAHQVDPGRVEYYSENQSAWEAGHQRELARLLAELRSGRRKYDVVLVWALDRLTRQGIEAQFSLVNAFKKCGAQTVSLQEPWTETLHDELSTSLLYTVVAYIAKSDSDRRSARVRAAHDRLRALGKPLGRPPGARDQKPRSKSGYYLRYASEGMLEKYPLKTGGD